MKEFELYRVYLDQDEYIVDPEEAYDEGSILHIFSILVTATGGEYLAAEDSNYALSRDELNLSRVVKMRKVVDKGIENWERVLLANLGYVNIRWEADPDGEYDDVVEYEINSLTEGAEKRKRFDDAEEAMLNRDLDLLDFSRGKNLDDTNKEVK